MRESTEYLKQRPSAIETWWVGDKIKVSLAQFQVELFLSGKLLNLAIDGCNLSIQMRDSYESIFVKGKQMLDRRILPGFIVIFDPIMGELILIPLKDSEIVPE